LLVLGGSSFPQKRSRSSIVSHTRSTSSFRLPSKGATSIRQTTFSKLPAKSTSSVGRTTYKMNNTTYIAGETYKTTGKPKVERSSTAKAEFLKSRGLKKVPQGYQVDHITPLSKGGQDSPTNMQLLSKQAHNQKTAAERK